MTPVYGTSIITDSKGYAYGYGSGTATIVADTSEFLDLTTSTSKTVTISQEGVNEVEIVCTRSDITQITLSASRNVRFSLDVGDYDFSAIGGGHNGGTGSTGTSVDDDYVRANAGSGGSAGGIINRSAVTNDGNTIPVVVGSVGQVSSVGSQSTPSSGASGGGGGYAISYGNGSGNAFSSTAGSNSEAFLYPPTEVGGAGGGGYAYANKENSYSANNKPGGNTASGKRGGGNGRSNDATSESDMNGVYPGSGGGGGCAKITNIPTYGPPGKGNPGLVGFVWHYK